MIETKSGRYYAIYDAPPALKKFFEARESGNASKELLAQLSEAAMLEQEAERSIRRAGEPSADVIPIGRTRRERATKAI
jgi:hypothetical protein